MPRKVQSALLALAILCIAAQARAAIRLCLSVQAPEQEQAELERLVRIELARHPSHLLVEDGCQQQLQVGLVELAGARTLTARIDQAIPVRFEIRDPDELLERLEQAISLVLGNDPVMLQQDIAHYSFLERASHSIIVQGTNTYRFELFQTVGRGGHGAVFAPGAAFSMARGSGHWQVIARIHAAGWHDSLRGDEQVLRAAAGADGQVAYELSALSAASFYASAGLGLQYQRYEGLLNPADDDSRDVVNCFLVGLVARVGVRFFRYHDFDCDLFAAGFIPFHPAKDVDSLLFGESGLYTPSLQVGLGVGF
ncbi:MAG: hypothetical protein JXR96_12755 [Deltaproteobacteria bacterium]|nr:hypothetical protein [Deltaproteobacteria bacterium]